MKQFVMIFGIAVALFSTILGLPLVIGVWLPDVVFAPKRILAEQRLANGHLFRVVQYWNHIDFYTTELLHISPDGTLNTDVLDGDDNKSWSVPLAVDETNKTVTVTLGWGRIKKVDWK